MDIRPFSAEAQEFASLEVRLDEGDFTLDELRDIEGQLVFRVTDKTRGIAQNIFTKIDEKRKSLLQRKIAPLELKNDVISRIAKLQFSCEDMDFEEADQKIVDLQREVALVEDPKTQAIADERLSEVRFSLSYPIAAELSEESFHSNFASRVLQVSKKMIEQNSLTPFKEAFNSTQQREILRYTTGGAA